jgi:hypothetical protein
LKLTVIWHSALHARLLWASLKQLQRTERNISRRSWRRWNFSVIVVRDCEEKRHSSCRESNSRHSAPTISQFTLHSLASGCYSSCFYLLLREVSSTLALTGRLNFIKCGGLSSLVNYWCSHCFGRQQTEDGNRNIIKTQAAFRMLVNSKKTHTQIYIYTLFCVNVYYCHRVSTQLQLNNNNNKYINKYIFTEIG